jgi:hypothetical protein
LIKITQIATLPEMLSECGIFKGELKQQCLDETGLYEWVVKKFVLRISEGIFEIHSHEFPTTQTNLSLTGARYAKEWSVTSAVAGFGFDIIWASGKIWSFLADDETSCREWVHCINESIQSCMASVGSAVDKEVFRSQEDFRAVLGVSQLKAAQLGDDALGAVHHRVQTVGLSHIAGGIYVAGGDAIRKEGVDFAVSRAERVGQGVGVNESETTADFQSPMNMRPGPDAVNALDQRTVPRFETIRGRDLNISDIPRVDASSSDGSNGSSPQLSNGYGPSEEEKDRERERERGQHTRLAVSIVNTPHDIGSRATGGSKAVFARSGHEMPPAPPAHTHAHPHTHNAQDAVELEALRVRCQQLSENLETEHEDLKSARVQIEKLQEQLDAAALAHERTVHSMRQREMELIKVCIHEKSSPHHSTPNLPPGSILFRSHTYFMVILR